MRKVPERQQTEAIPTRTWVSSEQFSLLEGFFGSTDNLGEGEKARLLTGIHIQASSDAFIYKIYDDRQSA